MVKSPKLYVNVGYFLLLAAVVLKIILLLNPGMVAMFKPSSLLILANISFVLALLVKK
jgi:hypothetical protein